MNAVPCRSVKLCSATYLPTLTLGLGLYLQNITQARRAWEGKGKADHGLCNYFSTSHVRCEWNRSCSRIMTISVLRGWMHHLLTTRPDPPGSNFYGTASCNHH